EAAQATGGDHAAHGKEGRAESHPSVDEGNIVPLRRVDHPVALFEGHRDRLRDDDVLAVLGEGDDVGAVEGGGRADPAGPERRAVAHPVDAGVGAALELVLKGAKGLLARIASRHDLHVGRPSQVASDAATELTEAENANLDLGFVHAAPPWLLR